MEDPVFDQIEHIHQQHQHDRHEDESHSHHIKAAKIGIVLDEIAHSGSGAEHFGHSQQHEGQFQSDLASGEDGRRRRDVYKRQGL